MRSLSRLQHLHIFLFLHTTVTITYLSGTRPPADQPPLALPFLHTPGPTNFFRVTLSELWYVFYSLSNSYILFTLLMSIAMVGNRRTPCHLMCVSRHRKYYRHRCETKTTCVVGRSCNILVREQDKPQTVRSLQVDRLSQDKVVGRS